MQSGSQQRHDACLLLGLAPRRDVIPGRLVHARNLTLLNLWWPFLQT